MDQYLEFASRHLMLLAAFVVVVTLIVYSYIAPLMRAWKTVSPAEATRLINRDNAVLLDVREDSEYHSGHIVNSLHIPMGLVPKRIDELEKFKNRPIIVGCRSGSRSGQTCSLLTKHGFETVYNLGGGIMAWEGANLPLSKK